MAVTREELEINQQVGEKRAEAIVQAFREENHNIGHQSHMYVNR
jgi:hypothetical protein